MGRTPILWLTDATYIMVIAVSALLTVAYVRWRPPPSSALLVADALGLAVFSVAGARIAERAGLPAVSGILLGTVTGAAGGMVRDILSAEIPLVLRRGTLYASAAIAGTAANFALLRLGAVREAARVSRAAARRKSRVARLRRVADDSPEVVSVSMDDVDDLHDATVDHNDSVPALAQRGCRLARRG